jgi:putative ABC transport system substrate-binding protein
MKTGNSKKASGFGLALFAMLFALCSAVQAQQPRNIPLVGYLAGSGSPNKAFVQGMRDLGYVEGKDVAFAFRTTEGRSERYADLAAELVSLKVDIIIADGTSASLAAKKATSTIPIVMTTSTDPVGNGLVASLAQPGGNVTGLSNIGGDLGGKYLELLKEIVPKLSRVVVLFGGTGDAPAQSLFVKNTEVSARAMGIQLIPLGGRGPQDLEERFRYAAKQRANGLIDRLGPGTSVAVRKQAAGLAIKNRLPAISGRRSWVDAGGLVSYGSDRNMTYRRAAAFVDKILKGAKPADLPVEQPIKFELIINLKTAQEIGLTIPPNVLARADRVIK